MEVLDQAIRKPNAIKDTGIRKEKDETLNICTIPLPKISRISTHDETYQC